MRSGAIEIAAFTEQDQQAFAALSRDRNPVHLDAAMARRSLFGQPIVHGVHLVLRALEAVSRSLTAAAYADLAVRFHKPVFLNEPLHLIVHHQGDALDIACLSEGSQLASISLKGPVERGDPDWTVAADDCRTTPLANTIADLNGRSGRVHLPQKPAEVRALFPLASALYGANRIANLLGVTYVVGMEAPGLDSLLATFAVHFESGVGVDLVYNVRRVAPKLSLVQLSINSGSVSGLVEAFVRPKFRPTVPETCKAAVEPGEFRDRRALVVGGSRGLGRLTALLLGAGGADVVVTFRTGEAEAQATTADVRALGASAKAVRLDVSQPEEAFALLRDSRARFTDLYYFATPHIFVRKKRLFEERLLTNFMDIYVTHFLRAVEETKRLTAGRLSVFYPSTAALNNPLRDLAEYCVAKAAGEAACEMLNRHDDLVNVVVSRLPRLPTEQTMSLTPAPHEDPIPALLGVCRKMQYTSQTA